MDFSKTTQYALRTLSYMAQDDSKIYIAKELHEKLKIPQQYLRALLKDLSKAGLLISMKGKGGGFVFARSTDSIYLADIVSVTEKNEILNSCIFGFKNCLLKEKCAMHDKWAASKDNIIQILQTTTLATMKINSNK